LLSQKYAGFSVNVMLPVGQNETQAAQSATLYQNTLAIASKGKGGGWLDEKLAESERD
jgi:hypothetical protein